MKKEPALSCGETTSLDDSVENRPGRDKVFSEQDLKHTGARGLRIKTGLRAGGDKLGH